MGHTAAAAIPDGDPQPKKGKSRKLLIGGAVAALLAMSAGGGYFFMRKPAVDVAATGEAKGSEKGAHKTAEKAPYKPMMYVPLETFTVNLHRASEERYLQVTINLELMDAAAADAVKQQMPSIRNRVLLLLSSKGAEELMTRDGKEKLSADIAAELRKTLDGAGPNKGLEQVLFSHFVIQ
jgi:flagellar FliL protein